MIHARLRSGELFQQTDRRSLGRLQQRRWTSRVANLKSPEAPENLMWLTDPVRMLDSLKGLAASE